MTEYRWTFLIYSKDKEQVNENTAEFASRLHDRLVGCKDYIDSRIVLNYEANVVRLIVDEKSDTIPVITCHRRMPHHGGYQFGIHPYKSEDTGEFDITPSRAANLLQRTIDSLEEKFNPEKVVYVQKDEEDQHEYAEVGIADSSKLDIDIDFVSKDMVFSSNFIMSAIK